MNTYRVYVLDTAQPTAPTVSIAFVRGEKYGDAWKAATAALNEPDKAQALTRDVEAKRPAALGTGDHLKVAKIDDIRPRNVKLDKTALAAILADPKATAEEKVKAAQALLG